MKRPIYLFLIFSILSTVALLPASYIWAAPQEHAQEGEGHAAEGEHHETLAQTIGKWFNFLALATILYLFLSRSIRVQDKFKSQAEEIKRSVESARLAKEEAEQKLAELDQRMLQMSDEIERIKAEAATAAEEEKRRIIEAAEQEATRIVETAHREIDAEVRLAHKQLRKHVGEIAVSQGRSIVQQEINEEDHNRIINNYIQEFGK